MGAGLFFGGRLVGIWGAVMMAGLRDSSSIISSSVGGAGHSGSAVVMAKACTASTALAAGASSAADS